MTKRRHTVLCNLSEKPTMVDYPQWQKQIGRVFDKGPSYPELS